MTNSTLSTPGQLLASIPGILGFYPSDSIVLMAFEETDGALTLGPTLRFDISKVDMTLTEALITIDNHQCEFIMPFAVTTNADINIAKIAGTIFAYAEIFDLPIAGVWHTTEIADGEPFTMIPRTFEGEDEAPFDLTHLPQNWKQGRIERIVNSATMEPFIREGRLPGYDRDEAHAPLHMRNPHLDKETLNLAQEQALHAASIMYEKNTLSNPRYGYDLKNLLDECEELIFRASTYGFDAADSCLHDAGLLGVAAMTMANTYVRDLTAATYLDHPEETAAIMLATSQSFTGTIRNNALCLYAAAQIKRGLPMYAGMALNASQSADQRHSLTRLMLECYLNGIASDCVDNIHQGSTNARSHHYRTRKQKQSNPRHRDGDKGEGDKASIDDAA